MEYMEDEITESHQFPQTMGDTKAGVLAEIVLMSDEKLYLNS